MKQLPALLIFVFLAVPAISYSQTNKNYILVNYSSICCGTPSDKPVIDFVKKFEKENNLAPFEMYTEGGLGEEGEFAICIGIDNLDARLLESFRNGLKVTAFAQNNQRDPKQDGYVMPEDKLVPDSVMKGKKLKPFNR